jgi:hypothetical protein
MNRKVPVPFLGEGTAVTPSPYPTALLDRSAALMLTDEEFDERRSLYEKSEGLRVPAIIHNYDYVVTNEW